MFELGDALHIVYNLTISWYKALLYRLVSNNDKAPLVNILFIEY